MGEYEGQVFDSDNEDGPIRTDSQVSAKTNSLSRDKNLLGVIRPVKLGTVDVMNPVQATFQHFKGKSSADLFTSAPVQFSSYQTKTETIHPTNPISSLASKLALQIATHSVLPHGAWKQQGEQSCCTI